MQGVPPCHRLLPRRALGRIGTAFDVIDRDGIRRHHAGARAGLDRHVAQRHAAFHGQRAYRRAAKFDGIAGTARSADFTDDGQRDVLGRDAFAQNAFDLDQHGLRRLLPQALRGQHVLDFGSTNAERQCTERAMGRGMRIATHHRHAGQGQALFRADDMDDALADIVHLEFGNAEFGAIGIERFHLQARHRIGNALRAIGRRHVVIGHGNRRIGSTRDTVGQLEAFEGLRAGDFVHQMAIDIKQRGAVVLDMHHMGVPQLLK